jgi:phospholipid transport system substrate-binding protein
VRFNLLSVISLGAALSMPVMAEAASFSVVVPVLGAAHESAVSSSLYAVNLSETRVEKAEGFIEELANNAIDFLSDEELSKDQRINKFKALLENRFDMRTIGRFALGRYWRAASEAQRSEYDRLFEKMIVDVYSARFEDYGGQTLSITGSRAEGKNDAIVMSSITQDNGPDVRVDWRVRYKDGRYRVIDVIVEGVSMALTQRSDFASVIQRGGGDVGVLIAQLKDH